MTTICPRCNDTGKWLGHRCPECNPEVREKLRAAVKKCFAKNREKYRETLKERRQKKRELQAQQRPKPLKISFVMLHENVWKTREIYELRRY
jgi:DnaJ-class molecular chaperone